jgi:hypothetical protein
VTRRPAGVRDDAEVTAALGAARRGAASRGVEVVADTDALAALMVESAQARRLLAMAGADIRLLQVRLAACDDSPAAEQSPSGPPPPLSGSLDAALRAARQHAGRHGSAQATAADLLEGLLSLKTSAAGRALTEAGVDGRALADARARTGQRKQATPRSRGPGAAWTVWVVVRTLVVGLFGLIKGLLGFFGTRLATVAFLPGVLALIGLRATIGRLLGLPVHHGGLMATLGGEVEIAGDRRRHGGRASIRLLPHLLLVAIGAVMLTPYLLQLVTLGVSPLPVASASPQVLLGEDLGEPVILSAVTTYGPVDLLRLWTGVACWFCAAPAYDNVDAARRELAQVVAKGQPGRYAARLLRWATAPLAWASRVLAIFDEAVSWVGGNVLLASGGVTLLTLFIAERRLIELLFG